MKADIDTLKRIGQNKKDALFGYLFYRRVSIHITRLLLATGITPNQVTVFAFLLAVVSAVLFYLGGYWSVITGAILLNIRVVFDCVDGELARIKGLQSARGALLDSTLGLLAVILVFIALALGMYRVAGIPWVWPVALLCVSGKLMSSFVALQANSVSMPPAGSIRFDRVTSNLPFNIGWGGGANELVILLGAILNQMFPALIAIAVLSNAQWIAQLLLNLKRAGGTAR